MRRILLTGVAFVGLAGLLSCSNEKREPLKTARVSGTVYLDGKPLENAEIRFYASDFVGFAMTGTDGTYELTQGALPGENRITIKRVTGNYDPDPESGQDLSQLEFAQESALAASGEMSHARKKIKDQNLPPQFSDPEKTELKFVVPEEGQEGVDFRLKSK